MIQSTVIMFLLSMFLIFVTSNAAKIFCVFPIPSLSHQQPMLALSRALASRGHNLTVITSDPSEVPIENHREINMHYLYGLDKQDPEAFEKKIGFTTQKRQTPFTLINAFPAIIDAISLAMFASPQIQDLKKEVNGTNFDLMIVEPMFVTSMLGFSDLIGNPPIVGIVSYIPLPIVDFEFGNPIIPSYIPHLLTPYTDCMSLFQRITNLFTIFYNFFILNYHIRPSQEKIMREQFGNTERFLKDLEFNKSLLIISADLSSSYPRPVQPNTIYVGPLHLKSPHPLAEDLKKWMDEAEDGIIYFSLGSNTKGTSMPAEKQKAFIKAFNQFPKMRVFWKWEQDSDLPGRTENIIIRKWFPQQSILAHPKMKLFISQVGVQSLQEAVYNAIPILGIPMTADQDSNIMKLETVGAGLYMEFNEINYETVYEKVKELLTNNSYKENMVRLSSIIKDKPMSAVDTAVWWVEYVLRHKGAPHLRPAALDLTWYQYHMLEVLVPLVVIIAIISRFLIYYTYYTIKAIWRYIIYYTYYTIKAIWRFYSPTPLSPVSSMPSTSSDVTAASTESPAKTSARKVRKIKKN